MSDLVGNPEDRFSRVAAHLILKHSCLKLVFRSILHFSFEAEFTKHFVCIWRIFEPRREKTGLRGFRPGPTQTGLYKLRKELED